MTDLSIGFSPCPNDTFIFNALVNGMITPADFTLRPEILTDVETLNQWAMQGRLDITKLSFHALMYVRDEYTLLRSGAALGRGCGPLLIQKAGGAGRRISSHDPVALPGRYTTAALLLRMARPELDNFVYLPFERIMPAVISGETAAGVIIHESRFTYRDFGLEMICDLGAWWEEETGHPIPLGGIAARRSLGPETIRSIERAIAESITWAFAHDRRQPYIKEHAQEMAEEVIAAHIGLYVNDFSKDLGAEGMAAVEEFWRRGTATAGQKPQP